MSLSSLAQRNKIYPPLATHISKCLSILSGLGILFQYAHMIVLQDGQTEGPRVCFSLSLITIQCQQSFNSHLFLSSPRKKCLLLSNIFLMTGALLAVTSRAAKSFEMIIISRVLVGINSGMSFVSLNICVSISSNVLCIHNADWNEN